MKKPFFARHAILVLIVVFFFVPFVLRGSRYAVERMKNDVKDWLPADFPETAELNWFRQHFLGEQFVVISWDGCTGDSAPFRTFVDKLFPEPTPSQMAAGAEEVDRAEFMDERLGMYVRSYSPPAGETTDFIGNELLLRSGPELYENWGGRNEKWIRSGKSDWVYITPQGDLFQWTANRTWPAAAWRSMQRLVRGPEKVEGEFITSLGPIDGPWYYEQPERLDARLVKSITSGPSVLHEMTSDDGALRVDVAEGHERLRGLLFGPDDRQTCIVVTLTEAGKDDPVAVLGRGMLGKERGFLLDIAEASGVEPPEPPPAMPAAIHWLLSETPEPSSLPMLRLGGPTVDNAAIDEEGQITLVRLLGLSLLVGLGLAWFCFRSINITIMVFLVGGISAVTSVGIVYWADSTLDAVLLSMPSLVYVLGISGAVHIVNYYRESVAESGRWGATDKAVKLGLWPCTMAAFTTSLGLISLSSSNIVPIQKFGIFSAVGVLATLILLFTYLPAALEVWPARRFRLAGNDRSENAAHLTTSWAEKRIDAFWQWVGGHVIQHYRFVAVGSLLAIVFIGYGLSQINTSIQLLKLFDGDAKIIRDYEWLEANLGKLVPMEIVIKVAPHLREDESFDTPASGTDASSTATGTNGTETSAIAPTTTGTSDTGTQPEGLTGPTVPGGARQLNIGAQAVRLNFLERMEIAQYAAEEIQRIFGPEGKDYLARPMLASTFAPEPVSNNVAVRSAYGKRLAENREAFVEAGFLQTDPADNAELWRISLRLAALGDIDFGDFVAEIKMVVEPILRAYEYRERIVRLAYADADDLNSTVYFVGISSEDRAVSPSASDVEPAALAPIAIDQQRIFVDTLVSLLQRDRLRCLAIEDPAQIANVPESDFIVRLDDVPLLDRATWASLGRRGIDATDVAYRPADATALKREQPISAVYTGLVPIVYKAQRTLLVSLIESTGWAFVMIALVMMFILRDVRAGMLSMLPNIFPVVIIFGTMGWLGILVDIGSMMTASVAMGVAVDDTIHFLSWFRRGLDAGLSRRDAILQTYRRVATAMTQTTAIGGIGLSIFAFSTFTPTQRFGSMMLALLAAALVGDLLFLPSLLASPLGRMFDPKHHGETPPRQPGGSQGSASGPHVSTARARNTTIGTSIRTDHPHD